MEPHLHVFLAVPRDCDTVNDEDILRYIFEDVWDHGALFCDVCFVILLSHGKHVSTHMFHAPSFETGASDGLTCLYEEISSMTKIVVPGRIGA